MKILIVDGQGGRIGASLAEQLKKALPDAELIAVGTNTIATAAMIKAGASCGATGENPVIVNARRADVITGPIGIIGADAMLGEVTPAMAHAIASSDAQKVLIPVNRCSFQVAGVKEAPLGEYIKDAADRIARLA